MSRFNQIILWQSRRICATTRSFVLAELNVLGRILSPETRRRDISRQQAVRFRRIRPPGFRIVSAACLDQIGVRPTGRCSEPVRENCLTMTAAMESTERVLSPPCCGAPAMLVAGRLIYERSSLSPCASACRSGPVPAASIWHGPRETRRPEGGRPAWSPSRRRSAPSVNQDERMREGLLGRNEVLDVDLRDQEVAIRIPFMHRVRSEPDRASFLAGDAHDPTACMKAPEVVECAHARIRILCRRPPRRVSDRGSARIKGRSLRRFTQTATGPSSNTGRSSVMSCHSHLLATKM